MKATLFRTLPILAATVLGGTIHAAEIQHDAEYYILEAQHGKVWAADDKSVDAKLSEFRKKNGGKSPNILYVLVDDLSFGEMGIPELNYVRGSKTPRINDFASFPIHQQVLLGFMTPEADHAHAMQGWVPGSANDPFALDANFKPDGLVYGLEG